MIVQQDGSIPSERALRRAEAWVRDHRHAFVSVEQWFRNVRIVVHARYRVIRALKASMPSRAVLEENLFRFGIDWLDIERVSMPFLDLVEPMRAGLAKKYEGQVLVREERDRYEVARAALRADASDPGWRSRLLTADDLDNLPDDNRRPTTAELDEMATASELIIATLGPRRLTWPSWIAYIPRPERMGAHALALYDLIAPKIPAQRRRGRRWPDSPQRYNAATLRIVRDILATYYDDVPPNVKSLVQAERKTRS